MTDQQEGIRGDVVNLIGGPVETDYDLKDITQRSLFELPRGMLFSVSWTIPNEKRLIYMTVVAFDR